MSNATRKIKRTKVIKRREKAYSDALEKIIQGEVEIGQLILRTAEYFDQKARDLDAQQEMIYNAMVQIADKLGVEISEPEPQINEIAQFVDPELASELKGSLAVARDPELENESVTKGDTQEPTNEGDLP